MNLLHDLQKSPCFSQLDVDRLLAIARIAYCVDYEAGCVVFGFGDTNRILYLVADGHIAIRTRDPDGHRATLLTLGPGELFGWSSFVPPHSKTAEAVALEQSHIVGIDAAELRRLCDADPTIGYHVCDWLNRALAERLHAIRLQIADGASAWQDSWVLAFP